MLRTPTSLLTRIRSAMASTPSAPKVPIPRNGVDYRGKIVLAPMVRTGELPTRLLALKYGADLVWGPETIDRSLIGAVRRHCPRTNTIIYTRIPSHGQQAPPPESRESIIYRLHPERESKQLIFQLGTASPELAVQAATFVAPDVAGIDVNSGCPKPFSTLGGMGAALLKDPDRLVSILEALVEQVGKKFEIGISVKIRLLETPELTHALVSRLVRTGITGLTIHCRTTPMRPAERALREQLRMIANTCHEAGVACLMNGDVESRDQALQLMEEFGVDGAMIATSAEKNPSVFRGDADGGLVGWKEVVRDYMTEAVAVDNKWGNTKFMLAQLANSKDPVYRDALKAKSYSDMIKTLGYDDLLEKAADIDENVRLSAESKQAEIRARKEQQKKHLQSVKQKRLNSPEGGDSPPRRQKYLKKRKREVDDAETVPSTVPALSAAAIAM
ncbi:FMN-linked oxidoreductase [Microthyrium microscopicum]|uniref:FMN-linked oxidoreductase n=1 Tax=Microthyrium microscopicum TaxID=703497 RepID=A0A6A6USF0_9PEZI|nr:FMN-linked oxidoreductase [Microthyrium microscopicum]